MLAKSIRRHNMDQESVESGLEEWRVMDGEIGYDDSGECNKADETERSHDAVTCDELFDRLIEDGRFEQWWKTKNKSRN